MSSQEIGDGIGGFPAGLIEVGDHFGTGVTSGSDLDHDGNTDLLVTAPNDDDGGISHGAVWIPYFDSSYQVKSHAKISDTEGGFGGALDDDWDELGRQAAVLGDLDGDGGSDLIVSQGHDDDGGPERGAAWVIFLPEPNLLLVLVAGFALLTVLNRQRRIRH